MLERNLVSGVRSLLQTSDFRIRTVLSFLCGTLHLSEAPRYNQLCRRVPPRSAKHRRGMEAMIMRNFNNNKVIVTNQCSPLGKK